eukprot:UN01214
MKRLIFDWLKPIPGINSATAASMEAMWAPLCFLDWKMPWAFDRFAPSKWWLLSFHLIEEIEHTHCSVAKLRKDQNIVTRFIGWFIMDFVFT